jgi:hypothetical protein
MFATWPLRIKSGNKWSIVDLTPIFHVFPAYDEQQGPSAEDYISDPDYPAEAYF